MLWFSARPIPRVRVFIFSGSPGSFKGRKERGGGRKKRGEEERRGRVHPFFEDTGDCLQAAYRRGWTVCDRVGTVREEGREERKGGGGVKKTSRRSRPFSGTAASRWRPRLMVYHRAFELRSWSSQGGKKKERGGRRGKRKGRGGGRDEAVEESAFAAPRRSPQENRLSLCATPENSCACDRRDILAADDLEASGFGDCKEAEERKRGRRREGRRER